MKTTCFVLTALTLLCCLSCGRMNATNPVVNAEAGANGATAQATNATNAPAQNANASVEPMPAPATKFPELFSFEESADVFTVDNFSERADENKTFAFGGFIFANQNKNVLVEDDEGNKTQIERSDIVVTENGRVVRRFAGLSYGAGVATRFGAFSFLGDGKRQVVIEQTINRGEYYWILEVAAGELRVIYEGSNYISAADFDGDGALEIVTRIETFWFFYHLTNVDSPFPTAIYKYNSRVKKYALANRQFTAYLLRDLDKEMRAVEAAQPTDEEAKQSALRGSGMILGHRFPAYLSAVVTVMADLIYAGEETRAWEFFEREYNLSDKDTLRQKIKEQIADDEIYRTLYRR